MIASFQVDVQKIGDLGILSRDLVKSHSGSLLKKFKIDLVLKVSFIQVIPYLTPLLKKKLKL